MNNHDFEQLVNLRFLECFNLLKKKAGQYSLGEEDRLGTFKSAGLANDETSVKALHGIMAKQIVTLKDYVKRYNKGIKMPKEFWTEVLNDLHNYLYLVEGLLQEEWDKDKKRKKK